MNSQLICLLSKSAFQALNKKLSNPPSQVDFFTSEDYIRKRYSHGWQDTNVVLKLIAGSAHYCAILLATFLTFAHAQSSTSSNLTQLERDYLLSLGTLKLCHDPDWLPFERSNANGNHEGIFAEYHQFFASWLNIKIALVPSGSWQHSIELFRNGECHLMSGLNVTPERENFMLFSDAFLAAPMVLISRQDQSYVTDLNSLSGKSLVSVKGYRIAQEVEKKYQNINMLYLNSTQEALKAVSESRAYAAVGSILGMSFNVDLLDLKNLKVIGHTEYSGNYRVGVQPEFAPLLPLLNKAIAAMPDTTKNQITNNWVRLMEYQKPDYTWLWRVLLGLAVVICFLIYRHLSTLKTNRQLAELNQRLTLSINEQKTLVKMVSHEYRTPLSVLKSGLRLLRNEIPSPSQGLLARLAAMDRATERMRDTLDISLKENRHSNTTARTVSEKCHLEEVLTQSLRLIKAHHHDRVFTMSGDMNQVIAMSKADLICCLDNLINNAVKYSCAEDGAITIGCQSATKDRVELSVQDRGRGVPEQEREMIFNKYFRGKNTQGVAGSGLGLSIVAMLLQQYRASIRIDPDCKTGSRFVLTLPLHQ